MESNKNITISDVAEALSVSRTTVSRAISGKGRIGNATRQRVLEYIKEHNYKPNVMAKGLATSCTYNICVVLPFGCEAAELPFFQNVLYGIQEAAAEREYDVLLCMTRGQSTEELERVIRNGKVDGVILLRSFVKDAQIEFLQKEGTAFVVAGSSSYEGVLQVDHKHRQACRELTGLLLRGDNGTLALLGGDEEAIVNHNRKLGYEEGFTDVGKQVAKDFIFDNLITSEEIEEAVDVALEKGAQCLVCMDDAICVRVLHKLRREKRRVPEEVRVASFYNSTVLDEYTPTISALSFDGKVLGKIVCEHLLNTLNPMEEEISKEDRMSLESTFDILLRESTIQE